ncbi:MAG: Methylenetetrahydrofolate--tRNA-(uracil-5-)-methyltransferase TrmFO, partial [uncultured Rubrobacteraceae bacterium]
GGRYGYRGWAGGQRGGLAGGGARVLRRALGDAARQGDAGPQDGVLRRARLLELARQQRAGDGLGAPQGGAQAAGVRDPAQRRRELRAGRWGFGRRPRGLPPRRHRDRPRPPEHRRDPRRDDGPPGRSDRDRHRPPNLRRPRREDRGALRRDALLLRRRLPDSPPRLPRRVGRLARVALRQGRGRLP